MKRPSSGNKFDQQAGHWLKKLRSQAGLTQKELSERLGLKSYAYVSLVENGLSRVSIKKMETWTHALGVNPSYFAKRLIALYDPQLHRILVELKNADDES